MFLYVEFRMSYIVARRTRPGLRLRFDGGANCVGYSVEAIRVGNGNLTEHLSIQCDIGLLAATYELAVPYASLPACGVEPDDPESAKFTFSSSSVFLSVDTRPNSGLFC